MKHLRNRNLWCRMILRTIESLLPDCTHRHAIQPLRILLSNIAHIGDVVIATSILPILKEAFPNVKIGFLIASWSKPILEDHPFVENVHILDHWAINRAAIPLWEKIAHYYKTRKNALSEIRRVGYDVSIDLRSSFPNAIPLCWRAKIPSRIGYISGGFGPLLTHPVAWHKASRHASLDHLILLESLGIYRHGTHPLAPFLHEACLEEIPPNTLPSTIHPKECLLFHMGAGTLPKQWSVEEWKQLAHLFTQEGYTILFTGQGKIEQRNAEEITRFLPHALNLCNRLSWNACASLISQAKLIICVDSMVAHVAAAWQIPTIVLFSGTTQIEEWRPANQKAKVLTHPMSCAPCLRKKGCRTMDCILGIRAGRVFDLAKQLL